MAGQPVKPGNWGDWAIIRYNSEHDAETPPPKPCCMFKWRNICSHPDSRFFRRRCMDFKCAQYTVDGPRRLGRGRFLSLATPSVFVSDPLPAFCPRCGRALEEVHIKKKRKMTKPVRFCWACEALYLTQQQADALRQTSRG